MSYCTPKNLIDRFGEAELVQLTDRDRLGVIDETVLAQAVSDADAEINAYLAAYPLPLAIVPANLTRIAADIARYHLYDDQMIDSVQERYKAAIRYLEQVASGKISLGPDAAGVKPDAAGDDVAFTSDAPVFGRDAF